MLADQTKRRVSLSSVGLQNVGSISWNLSTPTLYEQITRRREAMLAHLGPIVARTGEHTGRSPDDKFIVDESDHRAEIWWGNINRAFHPEAFQRLQRRQCAYLLDKDVFVHDCYVGADPQYRVPIRVITETAWHTLGCTILHSSRKEQFRSCDGLKEATQILSSGCSAPDCGRRFRRRTNHRLKRLSSSAMRGERSTRMSTYGSWTISVAETPFHKPLIQVVDKSE